MNDLLYTYIAEDIEDKINCGIYQVGRPLPSERTLALEYKVSRNTLREAIKILREKGLIENRMGKGNFISLPTSETISSKTADALFSSHLSALEIVDAREDFELMIARHILALPEIPSLDDLYEHQKAMDMVLPNEERFMEMDEEFHMGIAALTGNTPILLFYQTLRGLINRSFYYGTENSQKIRAGSQKEHLDMLDALRDRDFEKYRQAVHLHLMQFREVIAENQDRLPG